MNPITVLNKSNTPLGPFTRAQIAEKLQSGEIALTDLAFAEGLGLAQWTPLQDVLARADATLMAPPAPPVAAPPVAAPPTVAPGYSYAATMAPPTHLVYAGFWIRFAAYLLDGFILGFALAFLAAVLIIVVGIILGLMGIKPAEFFSSQQVQVQGQANPMVVVAILITELIFFVAEILVFWLYFAKLESGPAQATFGKRILGLRVTDMTGQRISFGHASGRTFAKIISALPMDIGFIMAAFTERKQALHDMIAGTLVIKG